MRRTIGNTFADAPQLREATKRGNVFLLTARTLQNCVPTYYEGEGHFSVLVNRSHELLDALRPHAASDAVAS